MTVFYVNVMNKAQLTKISDFIFPGLILSLIITQIFNPISSQTRDSNLPMALICIGAILALALIYVVTRIATSSTDTQEYARISTLSGNVYSIWRDFLSDIDRPSRNENGFIQNAFRFGVVHWYGVLPTCA